MVDNLSSCFFTNLDSGIPILSFMGDVTDNELEGLERLLITLHTYQDFRVFIREYFRLWILKETISFGKTLKTFVKFYEDKLN